LPDPRRSSALIVIPARWGSTRFPGKPLAAIAGRTLLHRTIDLARRAARRADVRIVVATDDARVADHAAACHCPTVMTASSIGSGSGRALAAALAQTHRPSVVLNLQGDAPFLPAEAVAGVLDAVLAGAQVATPVVQLSWLALDALVAHKQGSPFSGTTCVRAPDGRALWFSKRVIPAIRDEALLRARSATSPVLRHLGLYGYTLDALAAFEAMPPSTHEQLEGLEQLRFMEAGIAIQTVAIAEPALAIGGIDTREDVVLAEELIRLHGDPFGT
jgi:3-deoxy-manno-octulosonate cytidylyltransferase (CMP-KDO synthetase)